MPEVVDLEAKKLNQSERDDIKTGEFAFPRLRKLPIQDAAHVRNAMSRFNQTQGWTSKEKSAAKAHIVRKAKEFGIDVGDFGKVSAAAEPWTIMVEAKSLDMPEVQDHPNRMPFSGILTKVGVASDKAPNGADGKRVLLTKECCEAALDSLLGMGVNLASKMNMHAPQSKVGVITSAYVDGEDLNIEGFLYAADFPKEALQIHLKQADLGFSFEAQNLAVESLDDDPLIVKSCVFTGAAILMKDDAAYQTTKLAASKAMERETMEIDVTKAVSEAIKAALGPLSEQVTKIAASQEALTVAQTAMSTKVETIEKGGTIMMANAAVMSKVEPHAKALEAEAEKMEAEGIGVHSVRGHAANLRRMAGSMRADAATGKTPHEYHDSGSYWASSDPNQDPNKKPAEPDVTKNPAFVALQAAFDKLSKDFTDATAANETKLKDLQAASIRDPVKQPERKTLSPAVMGILNRFSLEAEEGKQISVGAVDKALASAAIPTDERLRIKSALVRDGVLTGTAA